MVLRSQGLQSVVAITTAGVLLLSSCAPARSRDALSAERAKSQALVLNSEALALEQKGAKPLPAFIREQLSVLNGLTAISAQKLEDPIPELLRALLLTVSNGDVNSNQSLGEVLLSMKPSQILESRQILFEGGFSKTPEDATGFVDPDRSPEFSFSELLGLRNRYSELKKNSGEDYANKGLIKELRPLTHSLFTVLNRSFSHPKNIKFRSFYKEKFLDQFPEGLRPALHPEADAFALLAILPGEGQNEKLTKALVVDAWKASGEARSLLSVDGLRLKIQSIDAAVVGDIIKNSRELIGSPKLTDEETRLKLGTMAHKGKALGNIFSSCARNFLKDPKAADQIQKITENFGKFVMVVSTLSEIDLNKPATIARAAIKIASGLLGLSESGVGNDAVLQSLAEIKEAVADLKKVMEERFDRIDQKLESILTSLEEQLKEIIRTRADVKSVIEKIDSLDRSLISVGSLIDTTANISFDTRLSEAISKCIGFNGSELSENSAAGSLKDSDLEFCFEEFLWIARNQSKNDVRSGRYSENQDVRVLQDLLASEASRFRTGIIFSSFADVVGGKKDKGIGRHAGDWIVASESLLRLIENRNLPKSKRARFLRYLQLVVEEGNFIRAEYQEIGAPEFIETTLNAFGSKYHECLTEKTCSRSDLDRFYHLLRASLEAVYGDYYKHRLRYPKAAFLPKLGFPSGEEVEVYSKMTNLDEAERVRHVLNSRYDESFAEIYEFIDQLNFRFYGAPFATPVDETLEKLQNIVKALE